jgi:NhaA family Na+:H+ antiporter
MPPPSRHDVPRAQALAERAFHALERFLHIEAVSGIVLLGAAIVALVWANSPWAPQYDALWHTPLSIGVGDWVFSKSLHFWINDVLMAVFFLVVGMEIRREIHEGALSDLRSAALPLAAALGGVVVPALVYLALNPRGAAHEGWAVPTATDIAFALGVLALLGRSIPSSVRVFLLALAIIDDIVAVLIIALVYSDGLQLDGLLVAGGGIAIVLGLQAIGVGSAFAYVLPAILVWIGALQLGIHPTLAGVLLGLMTPVRAAPARESPLHVAERVVSDLGGRDRERRVGAELAQPARQLRWAQRELLPPVTRVQLALHPWVAYGVMPLFALANAGVSLGGIDFTHAGASGVLCGVLFGLVLGKPVGIVAASWLAVKAGWCRLPEGVSWREVILIGLLAGIGFTMSIFIAMLAFSDTALLAAAKLGVLLASATAAVLGLVWALLRARRLRRSVDH